MDLLFGIFHLEEEQLSNDRIGDVVIDRCADEDDPITEESAVDVPGTLAAAFALIDVGKW